MLMSWTSSGTNRKHNLHISLPVDTWSHTCTHRISKSTSTGCPTHHLRVRTQTPPTDQVWNPAPCHTPLFSIVWLTGQVLALDWFAKHGLLPTYLLNIPRLFCHPALCAAPPPLSHLLQSDYIHKERGPGQNADWTHTAIRTQSM